MCDLPTHIRIFYIAYNNQHHLFNITAFRRQHIGLGGGPQKTDAAPTMQHMMDADTTSPDRLRGATHDLFELLERVQCSRLDDQRCVLPAYFAAKVSSESVHYFRQYDGFTRACAWKVTPFFWTEIAHSSPHRASIISEKNKQFPRASGTRRACRMINCLPFELIRQ